MEDDRIGEGLRNILHRLWTINMNDLSLSDDSYVEDSVDNIKSVTVDGIPIRKLFIGNIAQRTTHKDLERLFSNYGKLDSCYLKRNTGKSNYAFVTFHSIDDALKASKDGLRKRIHLHNRDLRVMPADSWHQPDSIENQNKKLQKSPDGKEMSTDYILNEDAEIHKLNDDCLMHVFSFLPIADRVKVERVCRRWLNVSQESWRTFKKLNLTQTTWGFQCETYGLREIDTPTLRKVLLRCGQFLTHIDFSTFAEKLSSSTLTVVGRNCPNLQGIDVTALCVSPAGIKSLTENCSNIMEFSLGHCSSSCDNDLSNLFSKNKKLRYLKLVHNSITGKCLLSLPVESIETIILEECTNISPCHFFNVVPTFEKLHTLSLEKCVSFNDQAVKAISLCSKSLKVLRLCDYYPMIKLNTMSQLAELVNLESLNVSLNVLIQDKFLTVIGTQCKQLTTCHSVTNEGLAAITSLPKLQHLFINYLGKITDEVLTDMPNLRTMECRGCPNLKDQGLSTLIEESQHIELLDLSGCNHISNELIEVAIKSTKNRTNNVILKMFVGDTSVQHSKITKVSPLLQVLNVDLSEPYLRPDFDHDEYDFFPDDYDMDDLDDIDDYDPFLATDDDDDDYDINFGQNINDDNF
ncbi:hypothetical protein TSAR_002554 [Trichomalopsis sarcophagae]|uniref:RRM domain-containing protein n=1 Tax=Trichomalopsis sarcophagae TaxID=543379 RepID=A0A232FAK1_9HYME|nr:hypothetical protein TSAR_002554 [Trichomalopsis sarcophagae]